MNSMKRQNDRILKEELPRSVGAQYATGDQWRNNSRKNEGMEPKQKQYPVVDPAVAECSVIGVPDTLRGQAIKAVVALANGYSPTKETELDIKEFCNRKLAEYKWIRIIEFVDEMPKTISGKIQKTVLRKKD